MAVSIIRSAHAVHRTGRLVALCGAGLCMALGMCELFARLYLGLGTPPLSVTHPRIEYLFAPNQDIYRFGNHFATNAYGMRSDALPPVKDPAEIRILLFGDSVVNGGSLIDQSELATTLTEKRLARDQSRRVRVGNVSAGSWGPGNWLAWVKEFGFLEADIVVVVLSSHDYVDNPTFGPLDPMTHPTEPPLSALYEGFSRYLPRYLTTLAAAGPASDSALSPADLELSADLAMADLAEFLTRALAHTSQILVVQHLERDELRTEQPATGYSRIKEVCKAHNITHLDLRSTLTASLAANQDPFFDTIHLNKMGQQLLADALSEALPQFLPSTNNRPSVAVLELAIPDGERAK